MPDLSEESRRLGVPPMGDRFSGFDGRASQLTCHLDVLSIGHIMCYDINSWQNNRKCGLRNAGNDRLYDMIRPNLYLGKERRILAECRISNQNLL